MIELTSGNLLDSEAEALVNAVNTVGVMGKGIALQFRHRFPEMFRAYQEACKDGRVGPGKMDVFDRGNALIRARWIVNFPTKRHWRENSREADIVSGLLDLVRVVQSLGIQSIAIPPLGCGLGGLDWPIVRERIESAFSSLPDIKVFLFQPVESLAHP